MQEGRSLKWVMTVFMIVHPLCCKLISKYIVNRTVLDLQIMPVQCDVIKQFNKTQDINLNLNLIHELKN